MKQNRNESALELITTRPSRKGRTESLLRLLINTSYPHATLANLTIDAAKRYGVNDRETLEKTAQELRELERDFQLYDFIRCIEVKRNGASFKVVVKRLKVDPKMKEVRDTAQHHELLASANIELDDGVTMEGMGEFAKTLLALFHQTQVKNKTMGDAIESSRWVSRTKVISSEGKTLDTLTTKTVDVDIDYNQALAIITESLNKTKFHVIITQNTILLLDQQCRIWGVNEAKG